MRNAQKVNEIQKKNTPHFQEDVLVQGIEKFKKAKQIIPDTFKNNIFSHILLKSNRK